MDIDANADIDAEEKVFRIALSIPRTVELKTVKRVSMRMKYENGCVGVVHLYQYLPGNISFMPVYRLIKGFKALIKQVSVCNYEIEKYHNN